MAFLPSRYPGAVFVCATLFLVFPSFAQLITTATISGSVTDTSGAVVPNATIRLLDEATHVTVTTRSNSDGGYAAPGLTVGTYSVTVIKPGFQTYTVSGIVL